jgi:hypothetical protein
LIPLAARARATDSDTPSSAKDCLDIGAPCKSGRIGRPRTIWEIQLTRIACALGDENLAGDGAAHTDDASS